MTRHLTVSEERRGEERRRMSEDGRFESSANVNELQSSVRERER